MTKIETQLTGTEIYPQYDALWHLKTLGVLGENNAPNGWRAAQQSKPTRIAVIDTSAAIDHPNLVGAINTELSLDLFSARLGSFPYLPANQESIGDLELNWATNIADGLPHSVRLLAEFIDRLSHGSKPHADMVQPCVSPSFSNHGTSISGLVGARPCVSTQTLTTGHAIPIALPYSGVDPMCEIVQISTNFDPNPEGLILAFLYADLIDADVVLFPRNIADPTRTVPELGDHTVDGVALNDLVRQVSSDVDDNNAWSELAQLIENVSQARPVVCAAGNSNEDNAIYPANLASEHNGIISVGAINAKGHRSSYSGSRNITVFAPSNDAEVFDRNEVRLDEQSPDYDPTGVPANNSNHMFSSYDVISTDVPGPAGYSGSPYQSASLNNTMREFGSYFSRFGGTSAASALIAGFLSLAKSTGRSTLSTGVGAKTWLIAQSHDLGADDEKLAVPCWSGEPTFPDKV